MPEASTSRQTVARKRPVRSVTQKDYTDLYDDDLLAPPLKKRKDGHNPLSKHKKSIHGSRETYLFEDDLDTWRLTGLQRGPDISIRLRSMPYEDLIRFTAYLCNEFEEVALKAFERIKPAQRFRPYIEQVSTFYDHLRDMPAVDKIKLKRDACAVHVRKVLNSLCQDRLARRDPIVGFEAIFFLTGFLEDQEKAHGDHFDTLEFNAIIRDALLHLISICRPFDIITRDELLMAFDRERMTKYWDCAFDVDDVTNAIEEKYERSLAAATAQNRLPTQLRPQRLIKDESGPGPIDLTAESDEEEDQKRVAVDRKPVSPERALTMSENLKMVKIRKA